MCWVSCVMTSFPVCRSHSQQLTHSLLNVSQKTDLKAHKHKVITFKGRCSLVTKEHFQQTSSHTNCCLQITMPQSISNETYANLFSQLAVLKCRLITPLPDVLKSTDARLFMQDLRDSGAMQTLCVCVCLCVCMRFSSCFWMSP